MKKIIIFLVYLIVMINLLRISCDWFGIEQEVSNGKYIVFSLILNYAVANTIGLSSILSGKDKNDNNK